MSILVTGGTGLIGQALIPKLLDVDDDVFVITRNVSIARDLLPHSVTFLRALSDFPQHKKVNAVINLAGEPIFEHRWSEKQKVVLRESRLSTTRTLVNWINNRNEYPVFISGSATGIYGNREAERLTEESMPSHSFTATLCHAWEQEALQAKARVCLLRTGMVFSPRGGALSKMLPLYKMMLGGKLGKGTQYVPWIALEDMVEGILFLLKRQDCHGVFNFVAPNSIQQQDLNCLLSKRLCRPALIPIPAYVLKLVLGERCELLLDSQHVEPRKLLEMGYEFQYQYCEDYLRHAI